MDEKKNTCAECANWDTPLNGNLGLGVCRLRPPAAYPGQTAWPVTRREERCIEGFRRKLVGISSSAVN